MSFMQEVQKKYAWITVKFMGYLNLYARCKKKQDEHKYESRYRYGIMEEVQKYPRPEASHSRSIQEVSTKYPRTELSQNRNISEQRYCILEVSKKYPRTEVSQKYPRNIPEVSQNRSIQEVSTKYPRTELSQKRRILEVSTKYSRSIPEVSQSPRTEASHNRILSATQFFLNMPGLSISIFSTKYSSLHMYV